MTHEQKLRVHHRKKINALMEERNIILAEAKARGINITLLFQNALDNLSKRNEH